MGLNIFNNMPVVYLDLETTGLSKEEDEIVQIAAKYNDKEFNEYVMPKNKKMKLDATEVNKITIENNQMFVKGNKVQTICIQEANYKFLSFLNEIRNNKKVILVAHNGLSFDFILLLRDAKKFGYDMFYRDIIYGFVDSLILTKVKYNKNSYSLKNLAIEYLSLSYDPEMAHNAIVDVRNMKNILSNMKITYYDFMKNLVTLEEFEIYFKNAAKMRCYICLGCLLKKVAIARISFADLKEAFCDNSLEELLEKHFTKNNSIIQDLNQYFFYCNKF